MRNILLFSIILSLIALGFCGRGGPDSFGYRWDDSDERNGPRFKWIDITETGDSLIFLRDNTFVERALSSHFTYYEANYETIYICDNGVLSFTAFGTGSGCGTTPRAFPSTSHPNNQIGPLWSQILPYGILDGGIYFQDFGDKAVISYIRVPIMTPSNFQTFQAIFYYAKNEIVFQYLDMETLTVARTAYIGWENQDGRSGIQIGTWTDAGGDIKDSLAIRIRASAVISPYYYNDFETQDADFTVNIQGSWEQGFAMPLTPGRPAHSGLACWGTALRSYYHPNADWILNFPYVDVTEASWPILDFWHNYVMQPTHDGGVIEVSDDDGAHWVVITPENGYPDTMLYGPLAPGRAFSDSSGWWEYVSIDLSGFKGSQVKVRLRFRSDDLVERWGWYIDDLGYHEAYGVLEGYVNLLYSDDNSGAIVHIPELHIRATTDRFGYFRADSVTVGTHYMRIMHQNYLTRDSIPFTVGRFDTITLYEALAPEVYFCDFDTWSGGMTATPFLGWMWGIPYDTVGPKQAYSDSMCWGTNLDGDYPDSCIWKLVLPVDLDCIRWPVLEFYSWYSFNGELPISGLLWDGGNVKLSLDRGLTWEVVTPIGGYDGTIAVHNTFLKGEPAFGGKTNGNFWHKVIIPIYDAGGQDSVMIKFEIGSDRNGTSSGWYIDNVRVYEDSSHIPGIKEAPTHTRPIAPEIIVAPNPFNNACEISFYVQNPNTGAIIFDIKGRIIKDFGIFNVVGLTKINWEPHNLPSGLYLIQVYDGSNSQCGKILYLR